VASCGAEIFRLVEDLGGGLEKLLESPRPHQGCRSPYLDIGVSHRFWDRDILFRADFLPNQFFCEDFLQGGGINGLFGPRVKWWRQGLAEIGLNVMPTGRNFFLGETNPRRVPCRECLQVERLCMSVQVRF